jgi:hypothetical protein
MKKFLGILVISASFVACNNSSEGSATSDTLNHDSANTMNAVPATTTNDSLNTMGGDSTHKMGADSTHKADSLKKK